MNIYSYFSLKFILSNNNSFLWISKKKKLEKVNQIDSISIDLLIGIDRQKKVLLDNTLNFANGNLTNNALLWGTRGNGKSSLIKSVFNKISKNNKNLKIIQINKEDIIDIQNIYTIFKKFKNIRFIFFIDDLSFEKIDNDYKNIKSALDGTIKNQPKNIILYVTSNRRHLMPRDMIDNERSSSIHTDESVEEKISLSDRFGLWIGFHNLSQENYLKIIISYCNHYKIDYQEIDIQNSLKWSMQRGNRNGRTAWQYIVQLAANKNLKINF